MRTDTGTTTVTTAGTEVRVNNVQNRIKSIVFKAPVANAGTVYVGPANVSATDGWPIAPGEESPAWNYGNGTVAFDTWWVDSATSGDKVSWTVIYEQGED